MTHAVNIVDGPNVNGCDCHQRQRDLPAGSWVGKRTVHTIRVRVEALGHDREAGDGIFGGEPSRALVVDSCVEVVELRRRVVGVLQVLEGLGARARPRPRVAEGVVGVGEAGTSA